MKPMVGYWWAACCEHDLKEIKTIKDVEVVKDYIENGPFVGLWETKKEALDYLRSRDLGLDS